jgi:hypothetical protein
MKNTNKHLDNLFAAARQQEPVISEEHARELLLQSKHMPSSKIISTKGAIMTSIGLSVAAVTAFIAFSGSPSTNSSQLPSAQPQSAAMQNLSAQSANEPQKYDA